ncbi:hypothetical protein [Halorussus salinisoli]|uniref:hypothetical protein n=1 Tax=Halorussus salinisoli TaxID=2558242 RepID=UPI0010C1A031|nr:hypothetical protein [Halorussus salinisoli]
MTSDDTTTGSGDCLGYTKYEYADDADATDTDSVTISVGGGSCEGYCGTTDNYTDVQNGRAWTDGRTTRLPFRHIFDY